LDGFVLLVEEGHVRYKVFDDVHFENKNKNKNKKGRSNESRKEENALWGKG
jgi:hypothetical protein